MSTGPSPFPVEKCGSCDGSGQDWQTRFACQPCHGTGEHRHEDNDCDCDICCQVVEDLEQAEDAKKEGTQCPEP